MQSIERFGATGGFARHTDPECLGLAWKIPAGRKPREIEFAFQLIVGGVFGGVPERFKLRLRASLPGLAGSECLISQPQVIGRAPGAAARPALQARPVF